jgi:hypothetical protein
MELVQKIRDFAKEWQDRDRELKDRYMSQMLAAKTDDEQHKAWDIVTVEAQRQRETLARQYDRRFRADVLVMRDELRSRVSPPMEPHSDQPYESLMNHVGLARVAADLETLANKLAR